MPRTIMFIVHGRSRRGAGRTTSATEDGHLTPRRPQVGHDLRRLDAHETYILQATVGSEDEQVAVGGDSLEDVNVAPGTCRTPDRHHVARLTGRILGHQHSDLVNPLP